MTISKRVWFVAFLVVSSTCNAVFGQTAPVGGISADDPSRAGARGGLYGSVGAEQLRQMGNYIDNAKAINRKDLKDVPQKEVSIERAKQILAAINLTCDVDDAELVGTMFEKDHGNKFQTSLYEIACANGFGYFLTSRDRVRKDTGKLELPTAGSSNAVTCFSADALHNDDLAKGIKSELYCQLPKNGGGDIKILAERLLASSGVNCKVVNSQWFGIKESSKSEITETACDNGTGYLLETALPGSNVSSSAINCIDAAKKGLDCKLTRVAKLPTLQTFKDYLAGTSVQCKVDNYDQVKVLGKESTKQRYIIEFKCPQQPNGLVAFIPLEGNTNKFETVDCAGIKKYGIACKLTAKN